VEAGDTMASMVEAGVLDGDVKCRKNIIDINNKYNIKFVLIIKVDQEDCFNGEFT
jgi:hypothetical protein